MKFFSEAYRETNNNNSKDNTIFYHLHNPNYYERASFNYYYPQNKSLFIVRNPIQMLESLDFRRNKSNTSNIRAEFVF